MSPFEIVRALRQHDVAVEVEGEELVLRARMAPPDSLLAELRWHREAIAKLLAPDEDGWTCWDVLEYVSERSAILDHDQKLGPREIARILVEDARRGLVPRPVERVLQEMLREEARLAEAAARRYRKPDAAATRTRQWRKAEFTDLEPQARIGSQGRTRW